MNPKRPTVKGVVSWNRTSTPFYKLVTDGKFFRTSFLQLCFNTCFDKSTCSQAYSPDTEQGHNGLKRLSKWNRWLAFHSQLQNWHSKIIFHIQVILKKTCRGGACSPCSLRFYFYPKTARQDSINIRKLCLWLVSRGTLPYSEGRKWTRRICESQRRETRMVSGSGENS